MTEKIKILLVLIITAAVLLISSCGEGSTDRLSSDEIAAFEDYVMSSYFMLRGDEEIASSKTAWPAYSTSLAYPADGATTVKSKQNYPERGQNTTVTIETTDEAYVYLVTNVTTYPKREDAIVKTTESYYVKDQDQNGTFDDSDPLWWDIETAGGYENYNERVKFETEYANDTIRYEIVEATTTEDGIKYAAFDIDGALTFPEPNNGDGETWSPEPDSSANYSSMVTYQNEDGNILDFWSDYKIVIGTRYYTEHGDTTKPTKTSISYEKVIERKTEDSDLSTRIINFLERLFSDDPAAMAYPGETLAETVIRYEITPGGKKTVKTQTRIFDSNDGASIVTFTAHFEEDENGMITNTGEPVTVY